LLKERNGAGALVRFEKALMLSKALQDRVGTVQEWQYTQWSSTATNRSQEVKCCAKGQNCAAAVLIPPCCAPVHEQVQERRAMRGLAAASRLQGQHKSAIKHLERVLEISKEMQEYTGMWLVLLGSWDRALICMRRTSRDGPGSIFKLQKQPPEEAVGTATVCTTSHLFVAALLVQAMLMHMAPLLTATPTWASLRRQPSTTTSILRP
jgi:hypothetical protein